MDENKTHIKDEQESAESVGDMLPLLLEWANKEQSSLRLIGAAMCGMNVASTQEEVFAGLSALSREMLGRMIEVSGSTAPFLEDIPWRQTVSVDRLVWSEKGFEFDSIPSINEQNPMSEWDQLIPLGAQIIRDTFRVFDGLKQGRSAPMDTSRLRLCSAPGCDKFFLAARTGKRESRGCSKQHRAIIVARELRSSPAYLQREKERNAKRMAAVRVAEKLMNQWINEGKTARERELSLRKWNEANGAIIGKRAFYNILEKGGYDNG